MSRFQPPVLIVQMERPPEDVRARVGEQPEWFRAALGDVATAVDVVRPFLGDALPPAGTFCAAVVTGSWAMVTDREPWSERTAEWLRDIVAADSPVLGVCYGHQLMAHALGGQVDYHPLGREVGLHRISLAVSARDDAMLAGLPAQFDAYLTHEQSVLAPPPGAQVLGASAHDPHQILRYAPNALSVQFHPEFTPDLMRLVINRRADVFAQEGLDVGRMRAMLADTPHPQRLLRRFVTTAIGTSAGAKT